MIILGLQNTSNCILSASVNQVKKEMNISDEKFGFVQKKASKEVKGE